MLSGKRFYLDIQAESTYAKMKSRIENLGGIVESSFSKDVSTLITFYKESKVNGDKNNRQTSGTKKCSNNLIERALQWSVEIKTVERFIKLLTEYEKLQASTYNSSFTSKNAIRCVNLKEPFIKVEDSSLNYRPIYSEFQSIPEIVTDHVIRTSPFYYPHRIDAASHALAASKTTDQQHAAPNVVGFLHSSGYCELCEKDFTHVTNHIKGKGHKCYASNDAIFADIDETIRNGFLIDRNKLKSRVCMKIEMAEGLFLTTIPLGERKSIKLLPEQGWVAIQDIGMFYHPVLNQSIIIYEAKSRQGTCEAKCLEYLNYITSDSAVHPHIISLSKLEFQLQYFKNVNTICVIESRCLFVVKNKRMPRESKGEVKLDMVLVSLVEACTDFIFTLHSYPKNLKKKANNDLKTAETHDPWTLSDLLNSVKLLRTKYS